MESEEIKLLQKKRKMSFKKLKYKKRIQSLNFFYSLNKNIINKDISQKANLIKVEDNSLFLIKSSSLIKSRNKISDILNDISEDDLCFNISREKALDIIGSIDNLDDKNEIINLVNKSLAYDNTNQNIIYSAFKRNLELKFSEENIILLKNYRLLLNKSLFIKLGENNNDNIFIPLNEKSIKSDLISILDILIKLRDLDDLSKEYKESLIIKFKIENDQITLLLNNNDENNKTNITGQLVKEFSIFLKKYKSVNGFRNNQPIKYELNPILYFSTLINNIFDIFLIKKIQINEEYEFNISIKKLNQISYIQNFINKIKKELLNCEHISYEIDKALKLLLFNLDSKHIQNRSSFGKHINFRGDDKESLTLEYFNNNKPKDSPINNIISLQENEFTLKLNSNYKINYPYNDYPKSVVHKILNTSIPNIKNLVYEECYLDGFQKNNFFSSKEINYIKYLSREILNSKLFYELLEKYSEKNSISTKFIYNKNIQDYIIDNITFLPYYEKDFDTQSITLKQNGEILISGYPYDDEGIYKSPEIHHILESGRKIVIIIHELTHCIKIYLSISTNGLINFETRDEIGNKIEAGYLTEHVLFGWDYKSFKKYNKNLFKGNKNLQNKKLDIKTALLLLNPELYNNNISSFMNIIYNNTNSKEYQNFYKIKKNQNYKDFLSQIGYKNEEDLEELIKEKTTISIGRRNIIDNTIFAGFSCGNDKSKKFE